MARFYFHQRGGVGIAEDDEGAEHPTVDSARAEAVGAAREYVASRIEAGDPLDEALSPKFEVVDDAGRVAFEMTFREAVETRSAPVSGRPTIADLRGD